MRLRNKQSGMTFFGILIVLGLIAFFTLITLKTVPLYLDYQAVSGALDALDGKKEIGKKGKKEILKRVINQLNVDGVKSFKSKDLIMKRDSKAKAWSVSVDYEAKANLFSNVYVMLHFQKAVEVPY